MPSPETILLASAGRLLLEYNDSTNNICRALQKTAKAISNLDCEAAVTYSGITVTLGTEAPLRMPVRELRYNAALQARVHAILRKLQAGQLDSAAGQKLLYDVEATTPRHPLWLRVVCLGVAAACLAMLLKADQGALIAAGISTGLGLAARHELARRHFNLLTLPLVAGFMGAVCGGFAYRMGWTQTPALALIVPSLMLVPGPHLINSLLDLVDNHLTMSLARLWLAAGILVASALGMALGIGLTLQELPQSSSHSASELNLVSDMVLAGLVTLGFALFYNTTWAHAAMAIVGGMIGHGTRYLMLESGWSLITATFLGAFAVGLVSSVIVRLYQVPLAVVAFAGAVTMMPGVQIYRTVSGSLQLANQIGTADQALVALTLGSAAQACYVVLALGLGLLTAARLSRMIKEQAVLG